MGERRATMLATIFRQEIERSGLTQDETAKLLGVGKSTVTMILRGKRLPSLALYERMVENFPGTLTWLTKP